MSEKNQAIRMEQLTKKYKEKTAVDGISLEIADGECLALLGVNGAGKTTTIRMLSCLSTPTSGEAYVYGHNVVTNKQEVKKLVGISTQDTAVAGNLTVEENLRFMAQIFADEENAEAKNSNANRKEKNKGNTVISEKVEAIMEAFHLAEIKDKKAKTLSGGYQRKLSIAMALIGEPKVLFLDEPTLGLDVLARRELWKEIESLKGKMTIILTTHYMEEAEALSDRIAVMINGKIVELGTLQELEEKTGQKGLENVFVNIAENNHLNE